MNFFLMKWFIDDIKNGKSVMYHNVETTGEEIRQRFLNTFYKDDKSTLNGRVLKYGGYKKINQIRRGYKV